MNTLHKYLIVIAGPTAVGKTRAAIHIAGRFATEILSADSRQFYREMTIGTAVPSPEELSAVKHHFVQDRSILNDFDVQKYATEATILLESLFVNHNIIVMTGGSGLYIDAVCKGLDALPDISEETRQQVNQLYAAQGLKGLQDRCLTLDPEYFAMADIKNPRRLQRAIEVCLQTGKPYSELRKGGVAERPFTTIYIGLQRERAQLIERINARTDQMIATGFVEEARKLYPLRHLNALNTVGYKELFAHFEGNDSLEEAISKIKISTRQYAKRQMTWFKKNSEYQWFDPEDIEGIEGFIQSKIQS